MTYNKKDVIITSASKVVCRMQLYIDVLTTHLFFCKKKEQLTRLLFGISTPCCYLFPNVCQIARQLRKRLCRMLSLYITPFRWLNYYIIKAEKCLYLSNKNTIPEYIVINPGVFDKLKKNIKKKRGKAPWVDIIF